MKRKRQKKSAVADIIRYGIMVAFDKAYISGDVLAGIAHSAIGAMDIRLWKDICADLSDDIISELEDMEENENSHL